MRPRDWSRGQGDPSLYLTAEAPLFLTSIHLRKIKMGLYLVLVDGVRVPILSVSCHDAGIKASELYPDANSITIDIDSVGGRTPWSTSEIVNFAKKNQTTHRHKPNYV